MGATGLEPPQSPNFGSSGLQGVAVYSQIMGWLLPILLSFYPFVPTWRNAKKVNLKPKVWAQRLLADPWGSERRSLEEPDEERSGGHQAPSPGVTGQPWRGAAPHR